MKVCLTGATGFIGTHLLKGLLEAGDEVTALALPETVELITEHERVKVVAGSLDDPSAVAQAIEGTEVIYHAAGILPGADPEVMTRVNVGGTESLLATCRGSRRFVFTSSVAVYEPAPWPFMWPITEERPMKAHGNDDLKQYGQSKIDAEAAIHRAHGENGQEFVILRPTGVYGPGAPYAEALVKYQMSRPWWSWAPWSKPGVPGGVDMAILADFGAMQWIHVSDLVDAVVRAGSTPGAANQIFTMAGSEVFNSAKIAADLWKMTYPTPWQPQAPTMPQALKFDISKAHRLLGFTPQVTLREGLTEMLSQTSEGWPGSGQGQGAVWSTPGQGQGTVWSTPGQGQGPGWPTPGQGQGPGWPTPGQGQGAAFGAGPGRWAGPGGGARWRGPAAGNASGPWQADTAQPHEH